jgi:upstream activation factor subunit UAF30
MKETISRKLLNHVRCNELSSNAVITPLTIVKESKNAKKPKLGSKTLLLPTPKLAKVIGPEPVSYKQSIKKLMSYLEENGLMDEENEQYFINADSNLKNLFGKKRIELEDVKDVFMDNLKEKKAA